MRGFKISMDESPMFATNKTSNIMRIQHSLLGLSLCFGIAIFGVSLSETGLSQDRDDRPIEEQMSSSERRATGISKLSPEELAALNAWLNDRSIETVEATKTTPKDNRGFTERVADVFRGDDNTNDVITSRLVGTFNGWDGETVFELENGMVWRQAETNLYTVRSVNNPEVVIRRGLFDRWRLQIKGYNKRLTVERVK